MADKFTYESAIGLVVTRDDAVIPLADLAQEAQEKDDNIKDNDLE